MKKFIKLILLTSIISFTISACTTSKTDTENDTTMKLQPTPESMPKEDSSQMDNQKTQTTYSLDEISQHNTEDDCWFAIEDKVYNVTEYISRGLHPGEDAILEGCGLDATKLFNTRPMGSGTPHSDKARSFLPKFEIGTLQK